MSQNRPAESELEELLERRSRVAKAYRESSVDQPPQELDDAILAASRRAVGAGPRRIGWARRWGAPFAAAAVLVLAVAVVLNLQDEPQIAQLKQAQAPATPPSPAVSDVRTRPGERDAAATNSAKREVTPEARSRRAGEPAASGAAPAQSADRLQAGAAPAPVAPAASSDEQRGDFAAKESAPERVAVSDAAPKSAAPGSGTAAGDDLMRSRTEAETTLGASNALRKQSAAPAATPIPPATLISQIEALYAAGRTEEGDRALREFCRGFPEHELPDALIRHADRLKLDCAAHK